MEKFTFPQDDSVYRYRRIGYQLSTSLYTHFLPETGLAHAIEGRHRSICIAVCRGRFLCADCLRVAVWLPW